MFFGRSIEDIFNLVFEKARVGFPDHGREYVISGTIRFSVYLVLFEFNFVLIPLGGEVFIFEYKVTCIGMTNLKKMFCRKIFGLFHM